MKEMKIYKYKFDFHIFAFPGVLTICPRILDNFSFIIIQIVHTFW